MTKPGWIGPSILVCMEIQSHKSGLNSAMSSRQVMTPKFNLLLKLEMATLYMRHYQMRMHKGFIATHRGGVEEKIGQ